ncbi:2-phosphosulfolactate phosphatase [Streptomyces sp. NPDC094438]|uniref:2-phosphosulfolactate phosphatase n=1 Tax=Streptomyces sp. NPDC094438 TaxID=3366061 RepID=UPI003807B215
MREHIWWAEQPGKGVRFEWGMHGAVRLADPDGCLVVVDVLSFSTTVSVAAQLGARVYPCAPGDEITAAYARRDGAKLAVARHDVTPKTPWSLSPAGLRIAPPAARLVLPCPDGSAIAALAATTGATVVAACLRNVEAVGSWLISHGYGTSASPVTVIAAGEHWPDGSLRPAVEDLLGAGALIAELHAQGAGPLSAEAATAKAACEATADPAMTIAACATSQHLAAQGYVEDVVIATGVDSCTVVPVLDDEGMFTPAR